MPQNAFFNPINPSVYCEIALYPLFYDFITYLIAAFHLFSNPSKLLDICYEYWLDSIYMTSWYELWLASRSEAGGSLELGCTSPTYVFGCCDNMCWKKQFKHWRIYFGL